jgi:predicted alpha/beta hydrolase family esterase
MPKPTNVVLLHGYASGPDRHWLPWMHRELESRGLGVFAPKLPDPFRPDFKKWFRTMATEAKQWNKRTVVVGHSLGGALALRLLEHAALGRVAACILVAAPFCSPLSLERFTSFFEKPIDWFHLQRRSSRFIVVQAKDDPLIPYDNALRYQEALESELHLVARGGHFSGHDAPEVLSAIRTVIG